MVRHDRYQPFAFELPKGFSQPRARWPSSVSSANRASVSGWRRRCIERTFAVWGETTNFVHLSYEPLRNLCRDEAKICTRRIPSKAVEPPTATVKIDSPLDHAL